MHVLFWDFVSFCMGIRYFICAGTETKYALNVYKNWNLKYYRTPTLVKNNFVQTQALGRQSDSTVRKTVNAYTLKMD